MQLFSASQSQTQAIDLARFFCQSTNIDISIIQTQKKEEARNLPSKLVMLPLNPHIEHLFMESSFPPRPLQPLHLMLLQPSPHNTLQLLPTNLLPRLGLLVRFDTRLVSRLHANPQRRLKTKTTRVAAHLDHAPARLAARRRLPHTHKRLLVASARLQRKRTRDIGRGERKERFVVRDGGRGRTQDPVRIAA